MHPHRQLVQRLGELLPPADDLRLDLRGGPGFRHRTASVVSSVSSAPPGPLRTGSPATGQSGSSPTSDAPRHPRHTPWLGFRTDNGPDNDPDNGPTVPATGPRAPPEEYR
ncbi:hypothetical protein GCM10023079_10670 [Streptomyces chitinivorans]